VLLFFFKDSAVLPVYDIRIFFKCTFFNAIISLLFLFFTSEVIVQSVNHSHQTISVAWEVVDRHNVFNVRFEALIELCHLYFDISFYSGRVLREACEILRDYSRLP
jgi:hypothetical protein